MKTSYIWYDCFIKELNIQDRYKNQDCLFLRPMRQDLFWVLAEKNEIPQLLTKVKDQKHKALIWEKMSTGDKEYFFFISRDGNYVQNYSFLMLNSSGSLWQKFSEIRFDDLKKLTYFMLPEVSKKLENNRSAISKVRQSIESNQAFASAHDCYPGA